MFQVLSDTEAWEYYTRPCGCIACQLQPINSREKVDVEGQYFCTSHPQYAEQVQYLDDLVLAMAVYEEDQCNETQ